MDIGFKDTLPDNIDALKQLVVEKQARIQFLEEQVILFKQYRGQAL